MLEKSKLQAQELAIPRRQRQSLEKGNLRHTMRCPECGAPTVVFNSRVNQERLIVSRRRVCSKGHRFGTVEMSPAIAYMNPQLKGLVRKELAVQLRLLAAKYDGLPAGQEI